MFRVRTFVTDAFVSLESVFQKLCPSVSQLPEQNCTLVASHPTPSTDLLESFCEFSSYKYLEYCLKELTTNYAGLYIGILEVYKREYFVLHSIIWDIRPIPYYRTYTGNDIIV